jgi:hypothetical protein
LRPGSSGRNSVGYPESVMAPISSHLEMKERQTIAQIKTPETLK